MREIKFRAWDNLKKKMIVSGVEWNIGLIVTHKEDFELMQFTGLKDKNKKEIFEGDIVRYKYSEKTSLSEAHYFKYIVTWDELNNRWCFVQPRKPDGNVLDETYTGGQTGQELNRYFNIEVIGNIYENSELLEDKK